ncbi:MAG: hypothetical protein H7A33_05525 [Deltaproteobacteria bacterium]|nr:hypothetical protein [Deltaproteobacteria bacterium]
MTKEKYSPQTAWDQANLATSHPTLTKDSKNRYEGRKISPLIHEIFMTNQEIKITAQPSADPNRCDFIVARKKLC